MILGLFRLSRLLPADVLAVFILTGIEKTSLFSTAFYDFGTALRAFHSRLFQERHGVSALRESRTGEKLSVRSVFYDHIAAAFIADHI